MIAVVNAFEIQPLECQGLFVIAFVDLHFVQMKTILAVTIAIPITECDHGAQHTRTQHYIKCENLFRTHIAVNYWCSQQMVNSMYCWLWNQVMADSPASGSPNKGRRQQVMVKCRIWNNHCTLQLECVRSIIFAFELLQHRIRPLHALFCEYKGQARSK